MAISHGEAVGLRAEMARVAFPHRYTRVPRTVDATPNDWNVSVPGDGTSTSGLHCRYRSDDRLRTDDGGRVTVSAPSLSVLHDDATVVGDKVSNVLDSEGNVLLAGPLAVDSVSLSDAFGPVLAKRLRLRAGDPR